MKPFFKHIFSQPAEPQTILITGASSGLGAALARCYAQSGAILYLSGRNGERLKMVAGECRESGAEVRVKIIDVRDKTGMADWIREIDQTTPLDLVIANAGISAGTGGQRPGTIKGKDEEAATGDDLPESDEQVRKIFNTNLTGAINTIHPALPLMARRGQGQVAVISSMAGFSAMPGAPAYSASKGAIRLYGEALAGCYRNSNIGVSVVCPGFIKTPMTDINPFPMPFLMSAEKAARKIQKGLEAEKPLIIFPYLLYGFIVMLGLFPRFLRNRILGLVPGKPRDT